MSERHGASTIKEWMEDLLQLAAEGVAFQTSAGAEPGRSYAYLEFHKPDGQHSLLLFRVEEARGEPRVRAHRLNGDDAQIRDQVARLTHQSA